MTISTKKHITKTHGSNQTMINIKPRKKSARIKKTHKPLLIICDVKSPYISPLLQRDTRKLMAHAIKISSAWLLTYIMVSLKGISVIFWRMRFLSWKLIIGIWRGMPLRIINSTWKALMWIIDFGRTKLWVIKMGAQLNWIVSTWKDVVIGIMDNACILSV